MRAARPWTACPHGQAVEQWLDQTEQSAFGCILAAWPPLLQRLATFVLEHQVGGAVGLEKTRHAHDVRMPECGQGARFHQKAVQTVLVHRTVFGPARRHRLVAAALRQFARQVLLDRDPGVQVYFGGEVGDAEAALSQHRVDAVFEQMKAGGQYQSGVGNRRCGRGPVQERGVGVHRSAPVQHGGVVIDGRGVCQGSGHWLVQFRSSAAARATGSTPAALERSPNASVSFICPTKPGSGSIPPTKHPGTDGS